MMSRARLLSILVLAAEDATYNRLPRNGYHGHLFNDPAERSIYRHYHRRFRRAWKRADEDRLARERMSA